MPIRLQTSFDAGEAGARADEARADDARADEARADAARGRPTIKFTRAAGVLELARGGDPTTERALDDVHVAVDAYGRILGLSPCVAANLGFSSARLIGRRLQNRVVASDRARFQMALAAARSAPSPSVTALRFRSSDERVVPAALTPLVVSRAGGSVVIVFRVALDALDDSRGASEAAS